MPKVVHTGNGIPVSSLPFSQVVEAHGLVFLAGQVGNGAGEREPVPGGIGAETRQTLDNIGALLRAVDLDYSDIVKATVYIVDMDEFAEMNAVWREYFATEPPTRATVEVSRLASAYRVEIEVVAAR